MKTLSVTEFTLEFKKLVESSYPEVWIEGEISGCRPAGPSGHLYFQLKDESSLLSVAFFGWSRSLYSKKVQLQDGSQILVRGRVSVFPPRGSYQLLAEHVEIVGKGNLYAEFEKLKQKLAQEGLFSAERKLSLPTHPKKVGVITALQGAALQDFLSVLFRRTHAVEVLILPSLVQGKDAVSQLIHAFEKSKLIPGLDLLVITRGGGSLEDLWCFNDETFIRKLSERTIPVISAVGHEVDFTLSDFVSDARAPTPSVAAEILSQGWMESASRFLDQKQRLQTSALRTVQNKMQFFDLLRQRLISPKEALRQKKAFFESLKNRLFSSFNSHFQRKRSTLDSWENRINALSPYRVLERGYCIVENEKGAISSVQKTKSNSPFLVRFYDGKKQAHWD